MRSESEMNEASGGCGGGMCERTRGHASDRPCHQISDRGVGVDGVIEWPSRAGGVIHPSPLAWPLLAPPARPFLDLHHAYKYLHHPPIWRKRDPRHRGRT